MNMVIRKIFRDYFTMIGHVPCALFILAFALLPIVPSAAVVVAYAGLLPLVWKNRFRAGTWRNVWRTPFPWMASFFLLHVIGMLWTTDIGFGLFDLQIKSPLLFLPMLAFLSGRALADRREVLLFVFAIANAAMVVVCTVAAGLRIAMGSSLSPLQEIFSSFWSLAIHPSYFALYLSVAIAAWCLLPMNRWLPRPVSVSVLVLLSVGVVLCGSKMGWILLPLLLATLLVLRWKDRALRTTLIGMGSLSALGIVLLVAFSPFARDRTKEMLTAASETPRDSTTVASSEVRRLTWSTAWYLFRRDPWLGTGTGDIKNELVAVYEQRGYTGAAERRLNAHNQYLQSAACLGVLGIVVLLATVLVLLFANQWKDPLVMLFLLLNGLNWLVESMLEVQAGVVLFALVIVFLTGPSARIRQSCTLT